MGAICGSYSVDAPEATAEGHFPGNVDMLHESSFGNPPYQAECIAFWVTPLEKCPPEYPHENQCYSKHYPFDLCLLTLDSALYFMPDAPAIFLRLPP